MQLSRPHRLTAVRNFSESAKCLLLLGVRSEAELVWRWWEALVASVSSRKTNFRSSYCWLTYPFVQLDISTQFSLEITSRLWTSCPMRVRCRGQQGTWSSSPPSCWWSRPWGIQWSRESTPALPFPRTASLRNKPCSWAIRRLIVELDLTHMCWWICFRCTQLYLKSALCLFRDVGLEKLKLNGRYIFNCEQSRKMQK